VEVRRGVRLRAIADEPPMSAYPTLDPHVPDDRIIATALNLGGQIGKAAVITADTGLYGKALGRGLKALRPPDDWLLVDEPDDLTKEVNRLKRENQELQRQQPELSATLLFEGQEGDVVRLTSRVVAPPSDEEIERRTAEVRAAILDAQAAQPKPPGAAANFAAAFWGISDYRLQAYLADYRAFLKKVHEVEDMRARIHRCALVIHNTGTTPAADVVLELTLPEGVRFLIDREVPTNPSPPKRPDPAASFLSGFAGIAGIGSGVNSLPRPYRLELPPPPRPIRGPFVQEGAPCAATYEVDRVTHHMPLQLPPFMFLLPSGWTAKAMPIEVWMHAANQRAPLVRSVRIRFDAPAIIQPLLSLGGQPEFGEEAE
jgi:hypothetical protein